MATSQYGIPDLRDEEGGLREVDHTFQWNNSDVTIRITPPTIGQIEKYQRLGDEAEPEEIKDVLKDHLVKPEVDYNDLTATEMLCYATGIMDHVSGGSTGGLSSAVKEELEARRGESEGN